MGEYQYRWSGRTLDELVDLYNREIRPRFEAEGEPTRTPYPSANWLRERGFGGLQHALREQHEKTVREFLVDDVGYPAERDPDRRFGIDDDQTHDAVDAYFSRREDNGLLAASTIASKQSRFKRWVKAYREEHGTDALVPQAAGEENEPVERERVRAVIDTLEPRFDTDRAIQTFVSDVRSVYSWLLEEGYIAFNPLRNIEREYNWDVAEPDNPSLSVRHVQSLVAEAEDTADHLLIVGLAGWGLRLSELASLHVSQLQLDGDDPHIAFKERKNGPGTVAIHTGRKIVEQRIDELAASDIWNGYLFPSEQSNTGHRHPDTLRRWFTDLAADAGVEVAADTATPKMGRRFWYSTYSEAMIDIMEEMDQIAREQGAESGTVVWQNYLDAGDRRERRRVAMKEQLKSAFSRDT